MTSPKIFGIGLSKTGTTSLYAALNDLDIPTITHRHLKRRGLAQWFEGDFAQDYLKDCVGVTDNPIPAFYPALDQRYPGSKFILTSRDEDAWLESIKRQFTSRPGPASGFKRDVRLSVYGISKFNEALFRRKMRSHEREVLKYFADRPEDFLHIDFFRGDGWEKLCAFLDRPVPDISFPNVKPGFEAGPRNIQPVKDNVRVRKPAAEQPFTFVICLRNPGDKIVKNYQLIETLLEKTVSSLFKQTYSNVHVVIVCNRTPAWAANYGKSLHILNVSNSPVFLPDHSHKNIDKGLRWSIGSLFTLAKHGARYVMLMDADDYVNIHLAKYLIDLKDTDDNVDFYMIDKGIHTSLHLITTMAKH